MIWSAVVVVLLDVWLFLSGTIASYSLAGLFDATSELGLSSWIAVTQASLTAVTVWGLVLLHRSGESRLRFWGWTVLAVFFTYLALDDGTHLHERIGVAFGESGASSTGIAAAFPSYSWQFLLGPFFAAMGMFTLLFLWREVRDPRLRWRFVSALALLVLAVAMDFVEGLEEGSPLNLYARLSDGLGVDPGTASLAGLSGLDKVVHLFQALEESIEIVAMTLLWGTFLLHAAALMPGLEIRWESATSKPLAVVEPAPAPEARAEVSAATGTGQACPGSSRGSTEGRERNAAILR